MRAVAPDPPIQEVRPWELAPGDVLLLDGAAFDVISEPFTGVAGTSLLDLSEFFWRVRVRSVAAPARVGHATWNAHDVVSRLRQRHGATDPPPTLPIPIEPRVRQRRCERLRRAGRLIVRTEPNLNHLQDGVPAWPLKVNTHR
jgi:hypothetical protein